MHYKMQLIERKYYNQTNSSNELFNNAILSLQHYNLKRKLILIIKIQLTLYHKSNYNNCY